MPPIQTGDRKSRPKGRQGDRDRDSDRVFNEGGVKKVEDKVEKNPGKLHPKEITHEEKSVTHELKVLFDLAKRYKKLSKHCSAYNKDLDSYSRMQNLKEKIQTSLDKLHKLHKSTVSIDRFNFNHSDPINTESFISFSEHFTE